MIESAAAPAPTDSTEGPAPSSPPAGQEAPQQPRNAIEAIIAKRQAKEAARAKEDGQASPEGAPAADKEGSEPAAEKAPEPAEKGLALRHARLKDEHRQVLAEREKAKGELTEARRELEELKGLFAPGKNHLRALEKVVGKSFREIVEAAARGAYDEHELPADVRAELDEMKQWRAEKERVEKEAAQAEARAEDLAYAKDFLGKNADAYPLFTAADWAADELVDRAYAEIKAGRQPDLAAITKHCEDLAMRHLEEVFSNERIMGVLVKRPKVAQALGKAYGPAQQNATRPASGTAGESAGNGPRTLSHHATQESPVPAARSSAEREEDWLEGAKARLRQLKEHGRITG